MVYDSISGMSEILFIGGVEYHKEGQEMNMDEHSGLLVEEADLIRTPPKKGRQFSVHLMTGLDEFAAMIRRD